MGSFRAGPGWVRFAPAGRWVRSCRRVVEFVSRRPGIGSFRAGPGWVRFAPEVASAAARSIPDCQRTLARPSSHPSTSPGERFAGDESGRTHTTSGGVTARTPRSLTTRKSAIAAPHPTTETVTFRRWVRAVLPEVDPLPGPEVAPSVGDGDGDRGLCQDAADVGGHVVRAFVGVVEKRVAVGDESGEEPLQVAADVRGRVLADDQRGARVVDEHGTQAAGDPRILRGRWTCSVISTVPRPLVSMRKLSAWNMAASFAVESTRESPGGERERLAEARGPH